jgi:hypothetical protein
MTNPLYHKAENFSTNKTWHKKWAVKIQHFPMSPKFDMWVDKGPTI